MTNSARLENAPPSFELLRIWNHALQGMIEGNSWKSLNKLFQSSEKNVVWWVKLSKKSWVRYFSVFCVIILVEYFVHFKLCKCYWIQLFFESNHSLASEIVCITKTFRRRVCFCITLCLVSVPYLNCCSQSYRSPNLSFSLLSLLWDYGW